MANTNTIREALIKAAMEYHTAIQMAEALRVTNDGWGIEVRSSHPCYQEHKKGTLALKGSMTIFYKGKYSLTI